MPQAFRPTAPPPAVKKPLFVGQQPRRRLRRPPAHEQHPFESMQAADPSLVSCGVFVIALVFLLAVMVFILLKTGGVI